MNLTLDSYASVAHKLMITTTPMRARTSTALNLRIVLADDHAIARDAIKAMLEREGFCVIGEASDGLEAVTRCREHRPKIAVLDLSMPVLNGVEAAREIINTCPDTRVMILTEHTHDKYISESLQLGVKGYVLKADTGCDLVRALLAVSRGETYVSPSLSTAGQDAFCGRRSAQQALAVQERRVLRLIAEGKNAKEIGHLLNISHKTVQSHRANIMSKLNIQDIACLVRYAISYGIAEL
jgi:DNA-binding NarL/FixJ family response regulator